ncbi:hypothetical protein HYS31_04925 [Candidatus Woesearchaeota archaeon]|nr:hypothetical protein [Candidatus Woesearchaeota archaeon]
MKLDKIWLERKELLDKLQNDVRDLMKWRIPWHQKCGHWEAIYSRFLNKIIQQDIELQKRLKP